MSDWEYVGPGNVWSSVRDLARWDANFYAHSVGGQALLDALRTRGKLDDGRVTDYGMGLVIGGSSARPYEWHNGGHVGYRAQVERFPNERLGIAVLCNNAEASPERLADRVAEVLLPADTVTPAPPPPEPTAHFAVDASVLAGSFLDDATFGVRVVGIARRRSLDAIRARRERRSAARSRWTARAGRQGWHRAVRVRTRDSESARAARSKESDGSRSV